MPLYNHSIITENITDTRARRAQLLHVETADSTYNMVNNDPYYTYYDGTSSRSLAVLPDATSLDIGHELFFVNDTTNTVLVEQNSTGTTFTELYPGSRTLMTLYDNTSSPGGWWKSSTGGQSAGYSIYGFYGGNALAGRYLEIYPGESSLDAPYLVVGNLAIVAASLGCTSIDTGEVSVFKDTDLVNPLYTLSLVNDKDNFEVGLFIQLEAGDRLCMQVTGTESLLKPYMTIYLSGI